MLQSTTMELSARAKEVLAALVQEYILEVAPWGHVRSYGATESHKARPQFAM